MKTTLDTIIKNPGNSLNLGLTQIITKILNTKNEAIKLLQTRSKIWKKETKATEEKMKKIEKEIENKDEIIKKLEQENETMKEQCNKENSEKEGEITRLSRIIVQQDERIKKLEQENTKKDKKITANASLIRSSTTIIVDSVVSGTMGNFMLPDLGAAAEVLVGSFVGVL